MPAPAEPIVLRPVADYRGPKAARMVILDMQRLLYKRVMDKETPAHIAAQCARAWEVLEERKRIIDGKPLPGQLRPDLEQRKNARRSKPLLLPEPIAETQAPAVAPQEKPA